MKQINEQIQSNVNAQMRSLGQQLPDSVPPLDLAIALAGKEIQERGFDPFPLPASNFTVQSGMVVKLNNGYIEGLSTVHRQVDLFLSSSANL